MEDWLKPYIDTKCPYCGGDMIELYNEEGKCTNRRCSNYEVCPGHNAAKAEDIMKILGETGIGYQTCLKFLKEGNYKSHLDCLKLTSIKELPLYDILRLLCIDGVDKTWKAECEKKNIYTLEQIDKLPMLLQIYIGNNIDKLNKILEYINIKKPDVQYSDKMITIMITGPVNGFANKNLFVEYCNRLYGSKYKTIHQETKRKTKVDYLIKEPQTSIRSKAEIAIEAGIPIITSKEYIEKLEELCKQ